MAFKRAPDNPDKDMIVRIFVSEKNEVCFFHDKPFSKPLSWLEFNPDTGMVDFVMEDGDIRNYGIPLPQHYRPAVVTSKNAYVVLRNPDTRKVISGRNLPIVTRGLPYY